MTAAVTAATTATSWRTPPLTTIFVPPATCFSTVRVTHANQFQYWLGLGLGSACLPSGAQSDDRDFTFSPALNCPYSYTTVELKQTEKGTGLETRAICCPLLDGIPGLSGPVFTYNSDTDYYSWYATLGCTASIPSAATFTVQVDGSSQLSSLTTGDGLNAYSVQIAWQASDLLTTLSAISTASTQFTRMATPSITSTMSTTSLRISATITSSLVTLTAATTPIESSMIPVSVPSSTLNSDLSTSSKIAIGILLPLGVFSLVLVTFLLTKRSQRKWFLKDSQNRSRNAPGVYVEPEAGQG